MLNEKISLESANLPAIGKRNGIINLFGNSTDNMLANHTNASLQESTAFLSNETTGELKTQEQVNSAVFFLFKHAIIICFAGVIELTRIVFGSRYKLDSLPVCTPSSHLLWYLFIARSGLSSNGGVYNPHFCYFNESSSARYSESVESILEEA
eukprot:IDg11124t1